jgi:hypothetical protein
LESVTLLFNRLVYCCVERFGDGDVDPDSNRKVSLVFRTVALIDSFGLCSTKMWSCEMRIVSAFLVFAKVLLRPFMPAVVTLVGVLKFSLVNNHGRALLQY